MRNLLVLVAACHYNAPGTSADDTTSPDSAETSDAPAIDMTSEACVEAARGCIDAQHSGHCQGGAMVVDRTCPPSSTCSAGLCTPPAGATACVGDVDCTGGQVCDVYVVGGAFHGFCSGKLGNATGTCAASGEDLTCDSGLCTSGDSTRCLSPCNSPSDCAGGSQDCVSITGPTAIEGQTTSTLKHCVPD